MILKNIILFIMYQQHSCKKCRDTTLKSDLIL